MSKNKNITYINFVAKIDDKTSSLFMHLMTERLGTGVKDFRINISSPGGIVFYAVFIFNFLIGLENVSIHTHNLGQIDSGANLIFLAGQKRTASKSSTFLLHPPEMTFQGQGNASLPIDFLGERLESLKKDQEKMAEIIASRTQMDESEVLKMFQDRKTYTSGGAKELGFISNTEKFVAKPGTPIYTITNQT